MGIYSDQTIQSVYNWEGQFGEEEKQSQTETDGILGGEGKSDKVK